MSQTLTQQNQVLVFPGPRTRKDAALDALPSASIIRWTATAKQAVVDAIRLEAITEIDACKRYNLTPDELDSWNKREKLYGRNGLMATQISRCRRAALHKATATPSSKSPETDAARPQA